MPYTPDLTDAKTEGGGGVMKIMKLTYIQKHPHYIHIVLEHNFTKFDNHHVSIQSSYAIVHEHTPCQLVPRDGVNGQLVIRHSTAKVPPCFVQLGCVLVLKVEHL
jgi:hypothetical protein